MSRVLVLATVLMFTSRSARADAPVSAATPLVTDAPAEPSPDDSSTARRFGAVGAAIVPGILVHGAGSWVVHERRAARRLAVVGWLGLGAMAIGGTALGLTRGAPTMVVWAVPLVIAGAGVVLPTWWTDIWVAAGGRGWRGTPHAPSPWSIEAGTTWLHDAYRERGLIRTAGRLELGRLGLGASTLLDPEGAARTGELDVRWRLLGAAPTGQTVADGSRLVLRAGLRDHRDDDDDVSIATVEAEVVGRLDLRRIDPVFGGSFLEISTGYGVEHVTYARGVTANDSLYLGRFAWGLYLGRRSEWTAFYDHRRDSLAGGIAAWRAAGFVGSVGTNVDIRLGGPWAFAGELEIGNGYVTTLGIRYHGGAP